MVVHLEINSCEEGMIQNKVIGLQESRLKEATGAEEQRPFPCFSLRQMRKHWIEARNNKFLVSTQCTKYVLTSRTVYQWNNLP